MRLVGVGVGPGDPEQITLQALRVLHEADRVLVPSTDAVGSAPGRAEEIVIAACPEVAAKIERVAFSMGKAAERVDSRLAAAQAALAAFEAGAETVALATIGDPSVYSTFSYLATHVVRMNPLVEVQVIPGITAMQALAAKTGIPLTEGEEALTLASMTSGATNIAMLLDATDTLVVYKSGRKLHALTELLGERAADAILGCNIGLDNELIVPLLQAENAPYFGTVFVPAIRKDEQ